MDGVFLYGLELICTGHESLSTQSNMLDREFAILISAKQKNKAKEPRHVCYDR